MPKILQDELVCGISTDGDGQSWQGELRQEETRAPVQPSTPVANGVHAALQNADGLGEAGSFWGASGIGAHFLQITLRMLETWP